jgi:tol-pal system protein YbgF
MRLRLLSTMFVAAALVAAAPAWAQRASLADRVAALEAQANNGQANMELLNQIQQLRDQVRAQQGTIEDLQHQNDQLKQQMQDQYLDLDGRLNRLEGGAGAPAVAPPAPAKPAAAKAAAPATGETAPAVHGDAGSLAAAADERGAYNVAFDALKNGKYDESAQLFQQFLDQYPNGVYAPNALYWLGESYYATRNFQLAEAQFRDLLARYPTHDKASGGMLKLGLSLYGEGKNQPAEQVLQQVITQYPNTDAARVAQDRLQAIKIGQLH